MVAAQNLVPNGQFESYTACPSVSGQFNLAAPWFSPTDGTVEYYNSCAGVGSYVGTPTNSAGVQIPHSGQGYAGAVVYSKYGTDNTNSTANTSKCLSSRRWLPARRISSRSMSVARNNTARPLPRSAPTYRSVPSPITGRCSNLFWGVLNVVPQVVNPSTNLLTSTNSWMLIQGNYTAAGGEDYLTLGNFLDDPATTAVPTAGAFINYAYYYFDDVSVVPFCDAMITNKTVPCGLPWTFDTPIGYDDCSGTNVAVSVVSTVTNSLCPLVAVRTWTFTDLCGNSTNWSQTVTVVGTNPPVVNCGCLQDSAIGVLSANACSGVVPNLCQFTNCFSATCGGVMATQSPPAGTILGPGTHFITVTFRDCSGGNSNGCVVPFQVNASGLAISCPPNLTLLTCGTSAVGWFNVTATGNTGPVVCSPPSGSSFPLGTTLVTCTATNACGGIATCSFNVNVGPYLTRWGCVHHRHRHPDHPAGQRHRHLPARFAGRRHRRGLRQPRQQRPGRRAV